MHLGSDRLDRPGHLVTERHRHPGHPALCPLVPVEDVEVGPADRGGVHAHEHLALARIGDRDVLELGAGPRCGLAQGAHRAQPSATGSAGAGPTTGRRNHRAGRRVQARLDGPGSRAGSDDRRSDHARGTDRCGDRGGGGARLGVRRRGERRPGFGRRHRRFRDHRYRAPHRRERPDPGRRVRGRVRGVRVHPRHHPVLVPVRRRDADRARPADRDLSGPRPAEPHRDAGLRGRHPGDPAGRRGRRPDGRRQGLRRHVHRRRREHRLHDHRGRFDVGRHGVRARCGRAHRHLRGRQGRRRAREAGGVPGEAHRPCELAPGRLARHRGSLRPHRDARLRPPVPRRSRAPAGPDRVAARHVARRVRRGGRERSVGRRDAVW